MNESGMMKTRQMKKTTFRTVAGLLLAGLLLVGGNAIAQQSGLKLEHKAEQWESVIDEDGAEQTRLVEAANVLPGEEVLFTVTYMNAGDSPAEDVVITNPVPDHMVYVDRSAVGDNTTLAFSVDGGKTFGAADSLTVSDANGRPRAAIGSDYTHLRWVVVDEIAAGATGTVQFKAVVK